MPRSARRSVLWLSLLSALALPSESIPIPAAPVRIHHPIYLHASSFPDVDLPTFVPAAPAHDCAGQNLHALLAKWQRLLRLEAWQMTIYCGLPESHDSWRLEGSVQSYPSRRLAYIYIDPESEEPLEQVVLHEVLHVALQDLEVRSSPVRDEPEERLVDLLTRRIYRGYEQ